MKIGDQVRVQGMTGLVVALISEGKFAESHPAEHWARLNTGTLILTDEAGLIHYPTFDGIVVEKLSK
ncbi:hypothetical protein [Bradyrhizobium sp. JR3.5]